MYCNVRIVEKDGLGTVIEREIVFIDGCNVSIVKVYVPICALHIYYIDVVTLFVEEGIQPLCRTERDIVL